MESKIDCAQACVNGCVLGDQCPNREYVQQASNFIQETSLDQMLAIADEALRKKRMAPPQWIIPEE
ncbi:hypothetical protein PMG71_11005 [Roseofilum sp. BLCC_M154]|uniref:Uncharacterized protein n=1 Tax=Roseofilum acuticapitatum BLCC-M154 TaxID=3022444 RepID=A0ABT7ASV6_9CYAN|nr:hypothetical protein [Roseofilum acuticapitatum]MDJ1169955.1 hypothetical protein [Roseofilum acuticapitatum BLCC-M154]